jgi:hypothetical protein
VVSVVHGAAIGRETRTELPITIPASRTNPPKLAGDLSELTKESTAMNVKFAWGFVAAVLLPLATGCTQNSGIVRGQNPAEFAPQVPMGAEYYGDGGAPGHHCPMCDNGSGGHPGNGGYPYPGLEQPMPFGHVLSHGPQFAGASGRGAHPTHYHWFSYEQPQNLVYPPENQPAAVIQYPYYTVKGPSDFFMK